MVPPEKGLYRFIEKEDKNNPLTILPSGSRVITVMEADISNILCEGISVNYDEGGGRLRDLPGPD